MKKFHSFLMLFAVAAIGLTACNDVKYQEVAVSSAINDGVKTNFQSHYAWRPTIDNRADAVMVYGAPRADFAEKVQSWRDKGYVAQFMTGIAWGGYTEFYIGDWDGQNHMEVTQVNQRGDSVMHGRLNPYIVPIEPFRKYMKEQIITKVIDQNITDIVLEEPEFWAKSGYSDTFKKVWKEFYGFDWRPQHESAENTYLSNKLKYQMYYDTINDVCTFAKEYGKSKGLDVKCYIATHSLLNYSQWQIVSPEASLASLPCIDGYIAQVWTGTSRTANYFNGKKAERTFETAYLEYGCMESMTAPTGRKLFFLTDPIEDARLDWVDYKHNYEATFTAELLYPGIGNYEVMPWPQRIYEGLYKVSKDSQELAPIPRHYSTQMQLMINSLNKMPVTDTKVTGTEGITVLMGNSLMFQGFPEHEGYTDPSFSNFYGQTLPLLKRGIPVKTAHLENLKFKESLAETKVLIMSYSNMKPMEPDAHKYLAKWVKNGGILIYSGRDTDPFQNVYEWWNQNGKKFAAPSDHLFKLMGIPAGAEEGLFRYGNGKVYVLRHDPKEYVLTKGGDAPLIKAVEELYPGQIEYKNNLYLERGMFTIAGTFTESVSDEPLSITGRLIDVYDPELPTYRTKNLYPGQQCLLVDVSRVADPKRPQVLAAASREYEEVVGENSYSYVCKSPINTTNVARVLLPAKPKCVKVAGAEVTDDAEWDRLTSTYRVKFENDPEGVKVEFEW